MKAQKNGKQNEKERLLTLMMRYGYTEKDLDNPLTQERMNDTLKSGVRDSYDYDEIQHYLLKYWGFCPPRPLLEELCEKFFDPLCPYFETGERECLMDEIARYLGFDGYPINMNMTRDFMDAFVPKIAKVIDDENWMTNWSADER